MSDYIKREDAIDACLEETSTKWSTKEEAEEGRIIASVIESLPSADVVEVVRCKDCKHHEELLNNNDGNVLCWVHGLDVIVDRNGYCSYGERK